MKNYTDLMIDLETLSTNANATILEIGWCFFDRKDRWRTLWSWSWFPDLNEQAEMGFQVDTDTIAWWQSQPEAYRRQQEAERQSVVNVVKHMMDCWNGLGTEETLVWAKGTHFDLPILRKLFPEPWGFRNIHDLRTLKLIAGPHVETPAKNLMPHSAIEDAVYQAREVIHLCSTIDEAFSRGKLEESDPQS